MEDKKEYIVEAGDTVQRVAIKFNTTTTDLAKENRLSAFQPIIFPGQTLVIPKPRPVTEAQQKPLNSDGRSNKVQLRQSHKSHPGVATRISVPVFPTSQSYSSDADLDGINERQFVKIKAYRIVGEELTRCAGTLLVTPKFLVFDPERRQSIVLDNDEVIKTPDPVYNVGLYILLDSIYALNTHSKLEEIVLRKNIPKASGESKDEEAEKEKPTETAEKTVSDDKVTQENVEEVSKENEKENLEVESSNDASKETQKHQSELLYLLVKATPLSDSYEGPSLPVIINISTSLQILPQDTSRVFVFGVAVDKIEEVYAFLITSGIGSNNYDSSSNQKRQHNPSTSSLGSGASPNHKSPVDCTSDQSQPQSSSVVADALKEFEEVRFQPQLHNGESIILSSSMLEDICRNVPTHLSDCNLHLVYQTGRHGYSLGTIYRKMSALSQDCPTLMLIRDRTNTVFGAFMSNNIRISTHYYGNGETFVFHWLSKDTNFKKYEWTRENSFFMKGDPHCFAIGARSGHSAIWFEDTLKYGRSEPTDTFENPKLSGSSINHCSSSSSDLSSKQNQENPSTNENEVSKTNNKSNLSSKMEYNFVIDALEVWRFSVI